ncbi:Leucine-rich repeat-containing egg-6, partial [Brachionus plicatilis]
MVWISLLAHFESKEVCSIKGCSCENDSGYDYVTCFFDSPHDLEVNNEIQQKYDIEVIDTFTLRLGSNISSIENIFKGLSINILFMDASNLRSLHQNLFNSIKSIKNIYLSNNFLTHLNFSEFDDNFKNSIQSIVLKNNSLNRIPPLTQLNNLNYMDLSSNRIWDLSALQDCHSPLETLDLSNNYVTHLHYNFSTKLQKCLSTLILNSNGIAQVNNLSNLDQLSNLQLSRNFLEHLTADALQHLPLLTHLDLSHNKIKTMANNTFDSVKELSLLDLSFNKIEFLQVDLFSNLKKLQKLFLQSNSIRVVDFSVFNNQKLLYVLDLSGNQIERMDLDKASNFTNLQLLRLSENRLESIDYQKMFSTMGSIRMLYLENNYLDQMPKYLGSLIKLDMSNQHDRLTIIPDSAFSRYDTSVLLRLNLSKNHSLKFSNRSFCINQKRSDFNYFMDLVLSSDTLASIDKCVLKQLSSSHRRVRIFTENANEENGKICD